MVHIGTEKCIACRVDSIPIAIEELNQLLPEIPDWEVIKEQGINKLTRTFKFRGFEVPLEFTWKVGMTAETEGHHPRLITEWGSVTVVWWTHKIKDLHRNDIVMAAKTDMVYNNLIP